VTRPSYDPMRAPAPRFPRGRFARVHDDARVAELEDAYERLDYGARVRFSHAVASVPDERLEELGAELFGDDDTPAPPPAQPTAQAAPTAPAAAPEPAPAPEAEPAPAPDAAPAAAPAEDAAPAPEPTPAPEATPAPAPAPAPDPPATAPELPVPPDQLTQLPAAQLRSLAADVGVSSAGKKDELAARIVEAVSGEQPAVTPEQVAADAASAPETPPPPPPPPPAPDAAPDATAATTAPAQAAPADTAAAPDTLPQTAPPVTIPETPAAPADGTTDAPTEGTAP
jgi:hypothetical protein